MDMWDPPPQPQVTSTTPLDFPAEQAPFASQPLRFTRSTPDAEPTARPARLDVAVTVLRVQIPRAARTQVASLWNHVREDVLDGDSVLRLARNGLRIGVGRTEWWDSVKAPLDVVEGVRAQAHDPVGVPANYPLALELDDGPRSQTLFHVGADGILSGETWPYSRNVLRVSYMFNLERPECLRLSVVPEVRQRLPGWHWVREESGLIQAANYNGRAFAAAGFTVDLAPGDFLLIAPGENADLFGILGGAFLSSERDGRRYDSYVFLRADVNHVAYRN
jgi:hypothetical protein